MRAYPVAHRVLRIVVARSTPVAYHQLQQSKMTSDIAKYPLGAKQPAVENLVKPVIFDSYLILS